MLTTVRPFVNPGHAHAGVKSLNRPIFTRMARPDGSLPLVLLPSAAFQPATEWSLLSIEEVRRAAVPWLRHSNSLLTLPQAAAVVIIAGGDDVPAQLLGLLSEAPRLVSLPVLITGAPNDVRASAPSTPTQPLPARPRQQLPVPTRRTPPTQARSIKSLVEALDPPPSEVHVDENSTCTADNTAWVGLMLSALQLEERPVAFVTSRTIAETAVSSARASARSRSSSSSEMVGPASSVVSPTAMGTTGEGLRFGYNPSLPGTSTWALPPPPLPGLAEPASAPNAVREFVAADGRVYCLDEAAGRTYWKDEAEEGMVDARAASFTAGRRSILKRGGEASEEALLLPRGDGTTADAAAGAAAAGEEGGEQPNHDDASVGGQPLRESVRASVAGDMSSAFSPLQMQETLLQLQQLCTGPQVAPRRDPAHTPPPPSRARPRPPSRAAPEAAAAAARATAIARTSRDRLPDAAYPLHASHPPTSPRVHVRRRLRSSARPTCTSTRSCSPPSRPR